jgi:serine/threonine protein kinase
VTRRLPPDDSNVPQPVDDADSAPRVEIHDQETKKQVDPSVANAVTVRGSAPVVPIAEESRNLALATEAGVRAFGLGFATVIDTSDPIIGRVVSETIVVVKKLGAGGMGSVYLAIDTQEDLHDRKYALKVTGATAASEDRERFKREVSAAARIRSKRVVQVHRHGTFRDHRLWMLMDFVDGISLEDKIAREKVLGVIEALSQIGLGIISAVASVHVMKVIHKDLKPANIMLEPTHDGDYEVKLLDFGIARVGGGDESVFKTNPNAGGGTPGYWSPEGIGGRGVEYRTDVWGIGVILFQMLTGELPFQAPDWRTAMADVLNPSLAAPSINLIRRQKGLGPIPDGIESLVAACLDKNVHTRISLRDLQKRLIAAVKEYAKEANIPDPLMEVRSEAHLIEQPKKPETRAGTADVVELKALMGKFSSAPATNPAMPAALRGARLPIARKLVVLIATGTVTVAVAATLILYVLHRQQPQRGGLGPTPQPTASTPPPSSAPTSPPLPANVISRPVETQSGTSSVVAFPDSKSAPALRADPIPANTRNSHRKRKARDAANQTGASPSEPAPSKREKGDVVDGPINPF